MKIKSIRMKDFKRFTDLTIEGLPETAKLVVMIGPNGCGKSSVFDALQIGWYLGIRGADGQEIDYYNKHINYYGKSELHPYTRSYHGRNHAFGHSVLGDNVKIDFWDIQLDDVQKSWDPSSWNTRVHIRSAYRNDSIDEMSVIATVDPIEERRFFQLVENDSSIVSNYSRLLSRWLEISSDPTQRGKNIGEFQDNLLGKLRSAISKLFDEPKLVLENLGRLLDGNLFQFDKGTSKGFPYMYLASGEKAAFDLLLDIIITTGEFEDALFCIDEPEAHIHTKLQGKLLEELYNLIPDKSQLWIATHSIGMVRKAQDLYQEHPESVVFLDFGNHNFDEQVTLTPAEPNPNFWTQTYNVALGDLAKLVAPKQIVLCEGKFEWETKGFDAACYNQIFGSRYPDTRFISIGNRKDVENADTRLVPVIEAIAEEAKILRLRDRDRATCQDRKDNAKEGIRILSRKYIEKYLLDDEVLKKLCISQEKSDEIQEFLAAKDKEIEKVETNNKIEKKRRPIVQRVQEQAEKILELSYSGDTIGSFMRDILAPLIKPGMNVYEELHEDIFGE